MRAASLLAAALLALASSRVDAVANCADCPSGKTCLLENKALALTGGASALALQFCNFDAAKAAEYALSFSLQKPVKCDPNATLLPKVTALTAPSGGCPADKSAPCAVSAALAKPLDWAIVLKNEADVSVLQAKLAGSDEVVQVAQGTNDAGAAGVTGDNAGATVCAASFSVKAARLSTLSACNKVALCRGKPADSGCTVPVPDMGALFVDDVTCAAEACSGTIALANALPCEAATDGNSAVLVSLGVANAANSSYASIATLAAAPAASASAASGVAVGSSKVTITTDATCQAKSLNVTFDGLPIKELSAKNGSIDITLASKLTEAGSNYDIVVAQCGVPSQKTLTVTVIESGDEALTPAVTGSSLNATAGSGTSGNVGDASPTGSQNTQKQNASTGLPYGLYIAIGVGVLALIGFAVECVYHRRRHSKEHGHGNGDNTHV